MVAALKLFAPDIQSGQIHSPHYPEPSLVYHFGQGAVSAKLCAHGRFQLLERHAAQSRYFARGALLGLPPEKAAFQDNI